MKNILLLIAVFFSIEGISQNGYVEYDTKSQTPPVLASLTSCITFDDSGNTWIGQCNKYSLLASFGEGIIKWNGSVFQSITKYNSNLISNDVYDIACQGNTLWIATKEGLQRFDNKGNSAANWKYFDSLDDKGLGKAVISLKIIDNDLWIGSDNGFGILNLSTLSFTYFSSTLWGMSKSGVRVFEKGKDSEIWIGTDSGLVKKSGANFTLFKETNNVLALIWDNDNNELWSGGNGGIFRIKNDVVESAMDMNNCFIKPGILTVTQFIRNKKYNVILAAGQSENYPTISPILITLPSQRLQKYYIKSGNDFVTSKYMAYGQDKNGNILIGFWKDKLFKIADVNELPNDGENFYKLGFDNPKNLDINQVNATMLNRGDMFWDLMSNAKYEVPKGSCKKALFASSLWMGGIDPGNNLHVAAMTYRQNGSDYYPGPLDTISTKGDTLYSAYNRIWKVSRWEIEELKQKYADGSLANGSYTPSADILQWPAHGTGNHSKQLAPFIDINNNGLYEPMKGDYPKIKGEQALYWIFNDNTYIHSETNGIPLGVEVHAMAYAYNCDTIKPGSPNEALNYTTFYEYKIINRSFNRYDNSYLGIWADVDLGNSADDYVGCYPPGNFAFAYNGDNDDEGYSGYGKNPPMLDILLLSDSMNNFVYHNNDFSSIGNPTLAEHYYGYMKSVWKDNSPVTFGGNGYNTGTPTGYMFSDLPYSPVGWNENTAGNFTWRPPVYSVNRAPYP